MSREELFEKYSIDESHNVWDNRIDNWYSVELYRIMHDGKLPPSDDLSVDWIIDFLDKATDDLMFLMKHDNWGSLYLTAKRMVYSHAEMILESMNSESDGN